MLDKLISKAVELGGKKAVIIPANTIVVSRWVQLKCQYGCPEYGKRLTCPPHSPSYERMKEILKEYGNGLLIHADKSWLVRYIVHELEKEAFKEGYYKAFGMGAGPCGLCGSCDVEKEKCIRPDEARPSMEACGIDVYATVRNNGFNINTLSSDLDNLNIFGLVLLE